MCYVFLSFFLSFFSCSIFSFFFITLSFPASLSVLPLLSGRNGETWVNRQVLICHPATKESITRVSHWEWEERWRGQGTAWLPTSTACSLPALLMLAFSFHHPSCIRYTCLVCTDTHSIQPSPWHTRHLLTPINPLINAIDVVKKPPDKPQ